MPRLVTAVIGAGPAGLLFCIVARLLYQRQCGSEKARWPILLFDKRSVYQRTHRLRMAPEPYLEMQRDLEDPRFDRFLSFLHDQRFQPTVNALEEVLAELAAELGVKKQLLCMGGEEGEVTLPGLRQRLEASNQLPADAQMTIVAADSVHSSTRELVRGAHRPVEHWHQTVARLRVVGHGLPERLGLVEQFKLSKVLGSILDYRLNPNGFAEVDLFLDAREHQGLEALGSSPREPVELTTERLARLDAPLLRRVVYHLRKRSQNPPADVLLQSTFRLEHRYMRKLVFARPELNALVFLVGDAGVSLPFFRGMACLGACVHSLAHAHCDLVHMAADERALTEAPSTELRAAFLTTDRPLHFGGRILPGRIERVESTLYRGQPAFVVLHRWLSRYGVHVLSRDAANGWTSHHHLAPVRRAVALADFASQVDPAKRYDCEAAVIRRAEIATVHARGRLIRGAREFVRLSALVPFPVQTWFLSFPEPDRGPGHLTAGVVLNAGAALVAAGCALAGPVLAAHSGSWFWLMWFAGLLVQSLGGVAYRAAQTFEPPPHTGLRSVWRGQIAALIGVSALATLTSLVPGSRLVHSTAWLTQAVAFVSGLYLFEAVDRRWFARAQLEPEPPTSSARSEGLPQGAGSNATVVRTPQRRT